jgi:hypothetical protein
MVCKIGLYEERMKIVSEMQWKTFITSRLEGGS